MLQCYGLTNNIKNKHIYHYSGEINLIDSDASDILHEYNSNNLCKICYQYHHSCNMCSGGGMIHCILSAVVKMHQPIMLDD